MNERAAALTNLLAGVQPVDALVRELSRFGWDSEKELVTLTSVHVVSILERYIKGELSSEYVNAWADAIEGRDDIGWERGASHLKDAVFELANPALSRRLSPLAARRLIALLGGAHVTP